LQEEQQRLQAGKKRTGKKERLAIKLSQGAIASSYRHKEKSSWSL